MALPARRSTQPAIVPAPWDPTGEFEDLQERMGQLMRSVFPASPLGNGGIWTPPVDIEETEDAWIVEAEVPGARKKDINVEMRDSELVISGDIKEHERKGLLRRRTRRTGRFEYRVALPGDPDPSAIDANLQDGVLTLRIPKADRARPQRIEIKEA